MDFSSSNSGFAPRQMVDVTTLGLKCANCSTDVTELPFQPTAGRDVFCRSCNSERRKNFGPRR